MRGLSHPSMGFLNVSVVKNLPAMQETKETWVQSWMGKIPGRRKCKPTPVFLPEKIPWTEEPGGVQSKGWRRVGHG